MKTAVLAILLVWLFALSAFAQEAKLMLPIGQTSTVKSAEFSPDGKRIITVSYDDEAKIWDAETYLFLAAFKGVKSAHFSPDGKKIVTASSDGHVKIWDVQTCLPMIDFNTQSNVTRDAYFFPDGKKVLTVDIGTVKIWDARKGKLLLSLNDIQPINKVCLSSNGKKIVAIFQDNAAKIWDSETGTIIAKLPGDNFTLSTVQFSPNNKKIVTASRDYTAKIWDAETGKILVNLNGHHDWVTSAQFSSDGKKVVTASFDSTAKVWNAENGDILVNIKDHKNQVSFAEFSPDGKKIVTGSTDSTGRATTKIWETSTGKLLLEIKSGKYFGLKVIGTYDEFPAEFSSDGKKIFIATGADEQLWDVETRQLLFDFEKRSVALPVSNIFFYPDGKRFVTAQGSICKIWDVATGKPLFNLRGQIIDTSFSHIPNYGNRILTTSLDTAHIWDSETGKLLFNLGIYRSIVTASFSPDGKKIATVYDDGTAEVWNASSGELLANLKGLTGSNDALHSIQFSPDGKKIVTASNDNAFKIWDSEKGNLLFVLNGHSGSLTSAQFSLDGKRIIAVLYNNFVQVWDAEKGTILFNLNGHVDGIEDVEFSYNGKTIVTASQDKTAKIWNIETGKLLENLKGHLERLNTAQFSTNGKYVVTSSWDKTAKIWDAETGGLLTDLRGHDGNVNAAQFSPNGKSVLTSSDDKTCKVWNAETGRLLYTFFAIDSADYMVTDPYGRYDGTEATRKLLYFTCGTDVIGLDQVKDQLWVPNLVERINKGDSINAKKLSDLDICGLIPHVEREDRSGYHFMITPQRGGLGETVLSVNGIEVKRYKPAQLVQTAGGFELNIPELELKPYFIAGQQNPVTVKAYTAKNDISSRMAQAMQDETAQKAEIPNLYAVMIGVSDYKSPELQLKYAAKDAMDISKAVASSARKLLNTDGKEHVYMYNLTTNKEHYQLPEKIAIKNIFTEIGKKATANDILLIFFAGHGVSSGEQKQFYFLTADASQATATDAPAEVGISTKELSEWMKPSIIKAQKRILILDACNSGQAINEMVKIGNTGQNYVAARNDDKSEQIKAIDKLNERSGLFILAASASNQNAYEMGRYSQGLLTYALLKAIKQEPDILEDNKYLNVSRWFNAAEKTVSDIVRQTGNRQEPQIVTTTNFNIGVVDQEVMAGIKLADEKPLFTASNLQNNDPDIAADDLHLNSLLDMQLNEIAARGDDNAITYIPGSASPDAYSLGGRYDVKGDDLILKVNIRQNDATKYKFELTGKKSDLKALSEQVVKQATDWIVKHK